MVILEMIKLIPENSTITFKSTKLVSSIDYSYEGEALGKPGTGKGYSMTNYFINHAEPIALALELDNTIKDLLNTKKILIDGGL